MFIPQARTACNTVAAGQFGLCVGTFGRAKGMKDRALAEAAKKKNPKAKSGTGAVYIEQEEEEQGIGDEWTAEEMELLGR